LRTVQRWIERAGTKRLDRVDFGDRPCGPSRAINRTPAETEQRVLDVRRYLKEQSALGEYGAVAIRSEMVRQNEPTPSIRTIGRILHRGGALDGNHRRRLPPPPPGWYLPALARRDCELDSFDTVSGLVIRGGTDVSVLTGVSIHGNVISAWPRSHLTSRIVLELLLERWHALGLPEYAQFDNDTLFQGPHQHRDVVGRVMRACLLLGVTPVFAPPREPGFQNAVESLNARWQSKVWHRFEHPSLPALVARSDQFVDAHRLRAAIRHDTAPPRRPLLYSSPLDLNHHPSGVVIFLRRTNDRGEVALLGRTFFVDRLWTHRLVRAEVDLDQSISFFALRRRTPDAQPCLNQVAYELPRRPFKK
jgi:hypothetical protein